MEVKTGPDIKCLCNLKCVGGGLRERTAGPSPSPAPTHPAPQLLRLLRCLASVGQAPAGPCSPVPGELPPCQLSSRGGPGTETLRSRVEGGRYSDPQRPHWTLHGKDAMNAVPPRVRGLENQPKCLPPVYTRSGSKGKAHMSLP